MSFLFLCLDCLEFYDFPISSIGFHKIKSKFDTLKAENIVKTSQNFHSIWAVRDSSRSTLKYSDQTDASELPLFDFNSILVATNNFNIENKLGEGGFGSVYKVIVFFI